MSSVHVNTDSWNFATNIAGNVDANMGMNAANNGNNGFFGGNNMPNMPNGNTGFFNENNSMNNPSPTLTDNMNVETMEFTNFQGGSVGDFRRHCAKYETFNIKPSQFYDCTLPSNLYVITSMGQGILNGCDFGSGNAQVILATGEVVPFPANQITLHSQHKVPSFQEFMAQQKVREQQQALERQQNPEAFKGLMLKRDRTEMLNSNAMGGNNMMGGNNNMNNNTMGGIPSNNNTTCFPSNNSSFGSLADCSTGDSSSESSFDFGRPRAHRPAPMFQN